MLVLPVGNVQSLTFCAVLFQPGRYETRLRGLLDAFQLFKDMGAPIDMLHNFLVRRRCRGRVLL